MLLKLTLKSSIASEFGVRSFDSLDSKDSMEFSLLKMLSQLGILPLVLANLFFFSLLMQLSRVCSIAQFACIAASFGQVFLWPASIPTLRVYEDGFIAALISIEM